MCVGDGVGTPVGAALGTEVGDGVGQLPHMTRQIAATAPSLQSVTPAVPQTSRSGAENPGHLGVAVGEFVGHELQVTGHVAETFASPQLLDNAKHPAGSGAPWHVAVGADVGAGVQVSQVTGQPARIVAPCSVAAVHRSANPEQNESSTTPAHLGAPNLSMCAIV